MDGWMNGWAGGWMDKWMDGQLNIFRTQREVNSDYNTS